MKIIVLNGSPKGNTSVTMQYVHFIQKKFSQHELKILNISERIKLIEKDENRFREIIEDVKAADGVLWAFPLYVFLVSSQYKRFIELIWEKEAEGVFKNKYTAVLTTSIHFFDHTAHNYMNGICDDLNMKYVGSFSADMADLLEEKGRQSLIIFAENFFHAIQENIPTSKTYEPLIRREFTYVPAGTRSKIDMGRKKMAIITDARDHQTNLNRMIGRFKDSFSTDIETVNLHDIEIRGGCLGCLECGYDYECSYTGKDQFIDFYNTKPKAADMLIFAGAIEDRYLSSRWKLFFDRSFFNTHTPSLIGKQIGFIISGPLSQVPNLRQILEAYTEWQQANLVGFITDEHGDSAELDALLHDFAVRLVDFADRNYMKPRTFLGVGGMKIFRDDIWGRLRFPFQADNKFYKRGRLYDFPQKDYKARITNAIMMLLTKFPSMRKEIYRKRMKAEMIKPFQKIVGKTD